MRGSIVTNVTHAYFTAALVNYFFRLSNAKKEGFSSLDKISTTYLELLQDNDERKLVEETVKTPCFY